MIGAAPLLPRDGAIVFEAAHPERHGELVDGWLHEPHVVPWWNRDGSVDGTAYLADAVALPHLEPWVASADGVPFAYVETYVAAEDPLARHYPADPGDLGWHVLVGPVSFLGSGVPRLLGRTVVACLLSQPRCERVVCEPDVRNARMLRFCAALGFALDRELDLPDKRAALLVCTPESFAARWPSDLALAAGGA